MSDARRSLSLFVVSEAILFDALDLSITQVALPQIGRELELSAGALQWIPNAYVLTYGGLPAAAMGLLIGRPLVSSLVASFRMRNARARDELGWAPEYPRFADGVGAALAGLGMAPGDASS